MALALWLRQDRVNACKMRAQLLEFLVTATVIKLNTLGLKGLIIHTVALFIL